MLNAVKESMKNWLKSHERLYWYIVVGIAVLAFGIITAVGCAKLERAEAAEETLKVNWKGQEVYFPLGNYPYYVIIKDAALHGDFVIVSFDKLEYVSVSSRPSLGTYSENGSIDKSGTMSRMYGFRNYDDYLTTYQDAYAFSIGETLPPALNVISNYDICDAITGDVVYNATRFEQYSPEAPHVMFESFGHDNKIAQGDTKAKLFDDIYEDYTSVSKWSYGGKIVNMTSGDVSYKLLLDVTVELPDDSLIIQMAEAAGVDITWERNALNYTPEFVKAWYQYNGSDFSRYKFEVELPITINERGEFGYEFSFPATEYLLMGDDNFRQRFQVYNSENNTYWKAILLSYLHIDTVSTVLETTRADSVVYGKVHSVRLKRGYEHWTSAITAVDKDFVSSDLLDSMVNSDLQIAEREHLNELENRLDEMQNQIDSMNNFETAFGGNLQGTDLWSGFGNLSKGVSSLGPSIGNISALTGQVFGFLPGPISSIMYFTLFAVCIIAIIKAIRG